VTKNVRAAAAVSLQALLDLPPTDEERHELALEEAREKKRQHELFTALTGAIKVATIAMGGNKVVAGQLDSVWGGKEFDRGVSESKYRACLDDDTRNYFRIEWLIELALNPDVAEVLRRIADGKAELEADEERDNLHEIIRERYPKDAGGIIRQARSMRRKGARR